MYKRLLLIGASRGLGRALARYSPHHFEHLEEITVVSRKSPALDLLKNEIKLGHEGDGLGPFSGSVRCIKMDMTLSDNLLQATTLVQEDFDLIIYSAGGGPHGEYVKKEWKDHLWSLQVNLIAPMMLIHSWLNRASKNNKGTFVVVGSRIAESGPDPMASSYAAGKTGLLGFIQSLQGELENTPIQVRLFSPGYMDTEMLPLTAKVRHDGSKLMSAETAAQAMLRWLKKDGPWHRVLN